MTTSVSHCRTFTYFLPAPVARKTGYQEKEFDNITAAIASHGGKIISIQSQALNNGNQAGLWLVCLIELDPEINIEELINDFSKEIEAPIEGLYYIDE